MQMDSQAESGRVKTKLKVCLVRGKKNQLLKLFQDPERGVRQRVSTP